MTTAIITSFALAANPRPIRGGVPVGYFDFEARGLRVRGCVLIRTQSGKWRVQMPRVDTAAGRRSVDVTDPDLFPAIRAAAAKAYEGLVAAGRRESVDPNRGGDVCSAA